MTIDVARLRGRTVAELKQGDRIARPKMGMGYIERGDGTIRSLMAFAPFEAYTFEVLAVNGTVVTARDERGEEITQDSGDPRRRVLVLTPEP